MAARRPSGIGEETPTSSLYPIRFGSGRNLTSRTREVPLAWPLHKLFGAQPRFPLQNLCKLLQILQWSIGPSASNRPNYELRSQPRSGVGSEKNIEYSRQPSRRP